MIDRWEITTRAEWLERRLPDVTASVGPCLFADRLHPYCSAYELWAYKSGRAKEETRDTPQLRRGRALEQITLEMAAELKGWSIRPNKTYFRDPEARIGATPDAFATRDPINTREALLASTTNIFGIVQAKTADHAGWRKHWINRDGEIDAPVWVGIQASIEAHLTNAAWAAVAVLELSKWEVHVIEVPLLPELMVKFRELVTDFWRRVEEQDPYPFDWEHDADLVSRIYSEAEDREIDLTQDNRIIELANERETLKAREADGQAALQKRKLVDAEILTKIQSASRARLADGRLLLAPTRRRESYQVKASSWRQISFRKIGNGNG